MSYPNTPLLEESIHIEHEDTISPPNIKTSDHRIVVSLLTESRIKSDTDILNLIPYLDSWIISSKSLIQLKHFSELEYLVIVKQTKFLKTGTNFGKMLNLFQQRLKQTTLTESSRVILNLSTNCLTKSGYGIFSDTSSLIKHKSFENIFLVFNLESPPTSNETQREILNTVLARKQFLPPSTEPIVFRPSNIPSFIDDSNTSIDGKILLLNMFSLHSMKEIWYFNNDLFLTKLWELFVTLFYLIAYILYIPVIILQFIFKALCCLWVFDVMTCCLKKKNPKRKMKYKPFIKKITLPIADGFLGINESEEKKFLHSTFQDLILDCFVFPSTDDFFCWILKSEMMEEISTFSGLENISFKHIQDRSKPFRVSYLGISNTFNIRGATYNDVTHIIKLLSIKDKFAKKHLIELLDCYFKYRIFWDFLFLPTLIKTSVNLRYPLILVGWFLIYVVINEILINIYIKRKKGSKNFKHNFIQIFDLARAFTLFFLPLITTLKLIYKCGFYIKKLFTKALSV